MTKPAKTKNRAVFNHFRLNMVPEDYRWGPTGLDELTVFPRKDRLRLAVGHRNGDEWKGGGVMLRDQEARDLVRYLLRWLDAAPVDHESAERAARVLSQGRPKS